MSIRCAWVVSLSREDFGKVLLYKRFVTVEKRCKSVCGSEYIPVPSPSLFSSNLIVKLGLSTEAKKYVDWRDKADSLMQLPVVEVIVNKQTIWPVVTMVQGPFLVCCLPFVEDYKTVDRQNLLAIPSVSVGFSVLLGILNFIESKATLNESQLMELDNYMTLSMPFGKPTDLRSCTAYLHNSQKFLKKQPAWRPFEYKGKQQILFKINEFVRSVQGDKGSICHLETFGQISVKADLEGGGVIDVSLAVTSSSSGQSVPLESVVVHPCVDIPGGPLAMGSGLPKRFRFCPPLHEFVLLQYRSPVPERPPVEGIFKMVGESVVELKIHLKLDEAIKNSFDYCVLILVFFHRGPVKSMEFNANHGSPKLTEDKYTLKWNLGSKFPRDLEAGLSAKVEFHDEPVLPNSDPFCVNNNSYVQLNFKQSSCTLSGVNIDSKNVTVSEGGKPRMTIDRSIQSTEYRIWNSYGDVPFPLHLDNKYKKVFAK